MTSLIIILALLLLCIFLLFLPLEILILARISGNTDVRIRITYFFQLLNWEFQLTGKKKNKPQARKGLEKKRSSWISRLYNLLQVEGLWNSIWTLITRLKKGVRIEDISADAKFSLGDDYYTGMMTGLILPLVLILGQSVKGEINLQPIFEEDLMLEGQLYSDILIRPIKVLIPCVMFACSPSFWRAGRKWIQK
ncbi:MAG: hypothetical protein PHO26_04380 [Dehalococcoidia bacterium]|nr:hypothetical protein [Dehalococcoidia bacterium]MDD5493886.1 hypothetical protein [Dehalococcoidia bacterium]